VSHDKCHISQSYVRVTSHHMKIKSHDECGRIVRRLCSSYISSIVKTLDLSWICISTWSLYLTLDIFMLLTMSWLGKIAKSFSIFIFYFLFFYLVESLLWRWSMGKESCHRSQSQMHDRVVTWQVTWGLGGKAHSHDSSCIYSVENQMETLLSSPCQLGLGVDLSCHS